MTEQKKIAVFGGTSHIARNLVPRFLKDGFPVDLFVRAESRKYDLPFPGAWKDYGDLFQEKYDCIINCVGAGTPSKLNRADWFLIPEKFDGLALRYLRDVNPWALYVNFSSGAIYGPHEEPVGENTVFSVPVNHVPESAHYSLMRLYAEAKHRSLRDLNIADIRIFSFFSRYAFPDSGYFMTDLLKALLENTALVTGKNDMVRDYIAPGDLYRMIRLCMEKLPLNAAMDAASLKPVSKQEILKCFEKDFGLKIEYASSPESPNGSRSVYVPSLEKRVLPFDFRSEYTSLQTLEKEMHFALKRRTI